MITFMESKEKMKEAEKCLDSQLWHACAGSMVQMPPVNSKVFYFPQGHSEHASGNVDFRNCPRVPAYVPCRVSTVKFMADPETDEVFAKIRLVPITRNEDSFDDDAAVGISASENQDKPVSFAKTLTQSDANNGGGFSVPRYCAETIFPRLDYSADPPVQTILAKDVHGETWKFRHIYRGTPRRHLLTTGWSTFVNHKKLVAGDSIVFMRAENGDLCVGIRRAKRGTGGGPEMPTGWNPAAGNSVVPYGGFSAFLGEEESKLSRNTNGYTIGNWTSRGRVKAEEVIEAATLAANGQPFDVVYYPRASTPEFCVKASLVKTALQIRWCSGMRFKMAFETEDSSRISWFMGTISSAQVADPIRWPDSPWRLLQVTWDEPDLLQNVKRVSPWLVELVSNMPAIHLSPFSPPRKKLRLPQNSEFPLDSQIPLPAFSGNHLLGSSNPFGCLPNNSPAGMQGARHAQYGLSLSDLHLNKLQSSLFPVGFLPPHRVPLPTGASNPIIPEPGSNENISCLLTMGNSTQGSKKSDNGKAAPFVLFGQTILTEKQISLSCSSDTVSPARTGNSSSGGNANKMGNTSDGSVPAPNQNDAPDHSSCEGFQSELNLETGHCKVFMESEDVGRTLDLSLLGSYEELYRKLASMFGTEISEMLNRVLYRDAAGAVRQLGDEPFSNFMKTARRLRILADSSSDNVGV
ncbi:auxin response factor 18 [Sesamum indicum]|uniref:Auxin response factor n=1 Tax=Sesamum indicum TaxID=4182 RepID=A0A6I9UJW0_SESIN|nr:auxin response factor 18 [Sesamum indicum]XP_011094652.1 auxin response factor 18 [Sesamum indicum]